MAPNRRGRDFVVGDLHGHRSQLDAELRRLGFDPRRDRLLSVGDLVDRGPESLAALSLLEEPWFHAVLGNHELALLNHLGCYDSRVHDRKAFVERGGRWVLEALATHRVLLERAVERLACLPLALHVDDEMPFVVSHGDLEPDLAATDGLHVDLHRADRATTARRNVATLQRETLLHLPFGQRTVRLGAQAIAAVPGPLRYVGHSPLPEVTVHHSHVYIDQRASLREARPPTVLEHRPFARWLSGATVARSRALAIAA